MNSELVLNLWAIYDASSGFVYALSGKAYSLSGTDDQKLAILKTLSATDYVTVKRYEIPKRFAVNFADGSRREGITFLNAVEDPSGILFEEMFEKIESEFPPIVNFSITDVPPQQQKLS